MEAPLPEDAPRIIEGLAAGSRVISEDVRAVEERLLTDVVGDAAGCRIEREHREQNRDVSALRLHNPAGGRLATNCT